MTVTAPPRTITKPGVVYNMPDAVYHADPVEAGSLSSTGARRILDSPARFIYEQQHREGRRAFDVGHVAHTKILGVGAPIVTYPDEHLTPSGNPSTKQATRAWEDEQRANGLAIISRADMALVDAMAEAVLAHKGARELLELPGHSEVSAFGIDPDTGAWTRARFDRLAGNVPIDVKTATSASEVGFGRDAAKFGYPIQEGHYEGTYRWATGDDLEPMRFICVEKKAPHLVAVHQFADIDRIIGADLAARARATYAECRKANAWPGYGDDILTPQLPSWWTYQLDDDQDMEF